MVITTNAIKNTPASARETIVRVLKEEEEEEGEDEEEEGEEEDDDE